MHSSMNRTGAQQRLEQKERLDQLAANKAKRMSDLASKIGHAAAHQVIWETGEPAENYLARLGFDLTKI